MNLNKGIATHATFIILVLAVSILTIATIVTMLLGPEGILPKSTACFNCLEVKQKYCWDWHRNTRGTFEGMKPIWSNEDTCEDICNEPTENECAEDILGIR